MISGICLDWLPHQSLTVSVKRVTWVHGFRNTGKPWQLGVHAGGRRGAAPG